MWAAWRNLCGWLNPNDASLSIPVSSEETSYIFARREEGKFVDEARATTKIVARLQVISPYFLMKYPARTQHTRLCPFSEWTSTDSLSSTASSMKEIISFITSSSSSNSTYVSVGSERSNWLTILRRLTYWSLSSQGNVKYETPTFSQRFGIERPAQFMTCVTLFATTNSRSWK